MKKTFFVLSISLLLLFGGIGYYKYNKDSKEWKIKITNDMINVREKPSPYEYKLGEVKFGEKYKVLDMFLEDNKYVWYKIKIKSKHIGWVASERKAPYVAEYNNPKYKDVKKYKLEYETPVINFFSETYKTESLKTIDYEHLTIVDDSPYTIKHKVYAEELYNDDNELQFWIQYIVKDKFDNESKKMQKIIFDIEPSKNEVLDFNEYKNKKD